MRKLWNKAFHKKDDEDKTKNDEDDIYKNPEKHLEINIIKRDKFRMVETFYQFVSKEKTFKHDSVEYDIDSKAIFLVPCKKSFMPTSYYIEGCKKPLEFTNMNRGIPCNALSLLWKYKLYKVLMELEEKNLNFILIVILLASMIMYGVSMYFQYGGAI